MRTEMGVALRRRSSVLGRGLFVIALLAGTNGLEAAGADSTPDPPALAFSASASATTAALRVVSPGAPASDTPIDAGGPTAQVAVDSSPSSTAYAAFPEPGGLVISGPGLAVGLLAAGGGGLPPVQLPSPPPYPFFVASDSGGLADQSAGSGPYRISARSRPGAGESSATGGFRSDLSGNAALTTATASVTSTVDSVTALAMSDTQGLSIGPLTIGEIRSTASQTFGGDGRVTPSSSLEITGIKLGTLPVSFTRDGVLVGASHTPVPVNETMAKLLAPSRITFRVLAAQEVPGRVVAPTVQITAPLASPAADGDPTTLTIVLGGATAALTATRDNPAVQADTPVGQTPGAPSLEPSTRVLAPVNPSVSAVDQLVAPLTEGAIVGYPVLASPAFGAGGSPLPARRPGLRRTSIATHQTPLAFDFNPLYVVFAIGAFAVLIPALVVRRVGTRP